MKINVFLPFALFWVMRFKMLSRTTSMNSDYGDGANPVILKSEFILSLCEQLIGGASLGAKQKSVPAFRPVLGDAV